MRATANSMYSPCTKKFTPQLKPTMNLQLETRLLTLTSDASNIPSSIESNTNFSSDLQGATPDLRGKIVGVSVESVSFDNMLNNVRDDAFRQNRLEINRQNVQIPFSIPGGFYNIDNLVRALQDEFDNQSPSREVEVTVQSGAGLDGGDRIGFRVVVDGVRWRIQGDTDRRDLSLATTIGMPPNVVTVLSDGVVPVAQLPLLLFRTRLQGDSALQVWSKSLVGSRTGLNGKGDAIPSLVTIPLTTSFGAIQTLHLKSDLPTLIFGPMDQQDINSIDISLRRLDGSLAEMNGGKMHITLRLFLYSM
jgi:hypothetical protein